MTTNDETTPAQLTTREYTEAEKRLIEAQYSFSAPFKPAQPLNARQKKAKLAKRRAVKQARKLNR